jgi:hypothetical protein
VSTNGEVQQFIREAILALLEVSYQQTADELIFHVLSQCDKTETGSRVMIEIGKLERENWLIYDRGWYRRRTQAQWDAIRATNNPSQGSLL